MTKRCTKAKPLDGIEIHRATWQGIEIEVRFERNWLGSPPSDYHPSHLEVEAIVPRRAELPVSETGYRSYFLCAEDVDEAGGVIAYVIAGLNEAAKDKKWKARQEAQRQLSLF